ncbi:MAG: D-glycero-D-manno-heptose 1,7-bisphosphate phosphatase [Thermomicrobiales bacterium]|jgi:D-glycero-D-manno-heptose 1,7-bisphosphate phosphatase|nr:D-glycero-D-manno-heptose 1,7-bisphosphate phosphatase [Thermomicrobiales bacterium]
MKGRALFIDRDGTLVEARHYPSRPDQLVVYQGVTAELRRLQAAGFRLVLITNQSGLAHGYFTTADLDRMHEYLRDELGREGVSIDGIYFCPHHPAGAVTELAVECDCRKPQPGMLLRAAGDLDLDLACCWFVGDILDDVEAGNRAGCRTVLVDLGTERVPERPARRPTYVARDTVHALRIIEAVEGITPTAELGYRPPAWDADAVGSRQMATTPAHGLVEARA